MFVPSLFTGKAIGRFGAHPVATAGCAVLGMGCLVALASQSLPSFHLSLMLVGIGWNFMYMGGSTLLAQVAHSHLRSRLQAVNEFATYAVMTATAALTGWFYHRLGWEFMLSATLGLLVILALLAALTRRKNPTVVTRLAD